MSTTQIAVFALHVAAALIALAGFDADCKGQEPTEVEVVGRAKSPHVQGPFLIPVTIRDVKYQFMVDTGCATTLADTSLLPALDASAGTEPPKLGETVLVPNVVVTIDDRDYMLTKVKCRDLSSLRTSTCVEIRGILGMDFLSSRVLCFDADSRSLVISNEPSNVVQFECLDVELVRDVRPYVKLLVNGVPVQCLFDTGSAGGLSLVQDSFEKVVEHSGVKPHYAPAAVGTIDGIEVGQFSLPATVSVGPTLSLDDICVIKLPRSERESILGNLFLCRFDWICDFQGRKLYLKKGALFAGRDFTDCGGMTVQHTYVGLFVVAVASDSIADRAGVLPGDEIRQVQSFDTHTHGAKSLFKELMRPQLDDVKLLMRRNGEVVNVTLRVGR